MKSLATLEVYTTGQVARLCHASVRTVASWIDSGELAGYRLPGSGDRRIHRAELLQFMRERGMIAIAGADAAVRVLAVGVENRLLDALRSTPRFAVDAASGCFAAGVLGGRAAPDVVVVDDAIGRLEAAVIVQDVAIFWPAAALVLVGSPAGIVADATLPRGIDPDALIGRITVLASRGKGGGAS